MRQIKKLVTFLKTVAKHQPTHFSELYDKTHFSSPTLGRYLRFCLDSNLIECCGGVGTGGEARRYEITDKGTQFLGAFEGINNG